MILYKGRILFATPVEFGFGNMEFDIHDVNGELVGNNFTGVLRPTSYTDVEKHELQELIEEHTMGLEIKVKFMKEFNHSIENWKLSNLSKGEIIERMDNAWGISEKIINKYF